MTNQPTTPREIDTKLAELYAAAYKLDDRIAMLEGSAKSEAGAEFYYRGRQRVTDMTIEQAEEILARAIAANVDESDYKRFDILPGQRLGNTSLGAIRSTVAKLAEARSNRAAVSTEILRAQALYTGWSRFFLVTSSAGHVHSSMSCSTCRPTTRYGWLPSLSGKTETEAVEDLGPTLCSVCFPSAPVEWTTGKKLTAAQAARKAA